MEFSSLVRYYFYYVGRDYWIGALEIQFDACDLPQKKRRVRYYEACTVEEAIGRHLGNPRNGSCIIGSLVFHYLGTSDLKERYDTRFDIESDLRILIGHLDY